MSTTTKIVIGVVILGAIGVGGYLLFFNTSGTADTSALSADNSVPASAAEETFLNLTTEAQSITFDTSVLSDPRFTSLVDTRTSIVPVPEGRSDPFAPLSGYASVSTAGN